MPALDENMIAQRDSDGFAGATPTPLRRRSPSLNRGHSRRLVMRRKNKLVADSDRSRLDPARKDPPFIHPINILNRKTKGQLGGRTHDIQVCPVLRADWAAEPRHRPVVLLGGYILAALAESGTKARAVSPRGCRNAGVFFFDLSKALFRRSRPNPFCSRRQ